MTTLLFVIAAVVFIISMIGMAENKKKKQYLNHLEPFKERFDFEMFSKKIMKKTWSEARVLIDNQVKKFECIDRLKPFEHEVDNYNDILKELDSMNSNEMEYIVNDLIRQIHLIRKYGGELAQKIIKKEYFLGMTPEHLVDSRGEPTKIETEVLKTKTKLIYIYGNKSSGDIFTFVNDELERFLDR